jgi:hypothetical protein
MGEGPSSSRSHPSLSNRPDEGGLGSTEPISRERFALSTLFVAQRLLGR